jgi:hypothetical protein
MGLNAVGSSLLSPSSQYHQNVPNGIGISENSPQNEYGLNAQLMMEQYKSNSMSLQYISRDGDTVSFSMESVEYSGSIMNISAEGAQDDMKKLVDYIKDNFAQMKKELLGSFLKSIGEDAPETEKVRNVPKLEIPEYWNAENTSQRIVDFATSFLDVFEGKGESFLTIIKDAIDDGFSQAREMLGELPDAVAELSDDTYALTMDKLDAWAIEQGMESVEAAEKVEA